MSAENEFRQDQGPRQSAGSGYQDPHISPAMYPQHGDYMGLESPGPLSMDRSIMAPLIAEYDRHIDDMTRQLQLYQRQMADIKVKLETVIQENERLHSELRASVEKQLQTLPVGSSLDGESVADDVILKSLKEQLEHSVNEKQWAMEMWQTAVQELERLQKLHQSSVTDGQAQASQHQQLRNQLVQVQQHLQKLQSVNQKLELTNQQFLKTVTEQSTELEEVRGQLRQAKLDLRTATGKVEEMTRLLQNVQEQMQRKEEDATEAHGREDASDRRLQQLQTALGQLESRLKAATQEAEQARRERVAWERQVGEMQGRCSTLEEEKYEAYDKVRDSIQLAEEASLQKEQAQLREKQKTEELEKMKEAMKQLVQDAAVRTRKEVENVRKQCNVQIHRMAEELSALQLECADKESQIERSHRERKAVEEELEKMYREGRSGEPEFRKMEVLHQRCLNAERLKDDMHLTLQSTQTKMKKMDMDYTEELSRCQDEVRRMQAALVGARDDCGTISEERLQLQQENQQLRKDMEEQRKASLLVQRKAKQQVSHMEQEFSVKEQGLDARLRELEESRQSSSSDLTRLLLAQQKTTNRWKEEAKKLAEAFECKLSSLRSELLRQKQRSQELDIQLESDHEKILEYERQVAEFQEKNGRLQRRLSQAEQRAATASQQLNILQRRKTASLVDLETL
ncbi:sodium channel and clathrin linker 1 [Clupea harengus]|uniref:Sodium channel and clathrin linker 1 n=1 Tax=Clupea harengus TaxID=7950 RepID=A0A6P8EXS2_CLUHA|nr:sodium channel and clathrin linker 1 [Clupea harengus]XP_031415692.1 sodium channel and clathrin linker 1 [Clupea harengus]XP_031415693.1 sodium channel and clathrin linker 1 [Clupea harengus]XP_042558964.1 sodium channel and clathrin linker 1 [Clupea harengus]